MIDIKEFQSALPTNYRTTMQNIEGQGSQSRSNRSTTKFTGMMSELENDNEISTQMQAKLDDDKWKELIAMADKDGDGMVSLKDFT